MKTPSAQWPVMPNTCPDRALGAAEGSSSLAMGGPMKRSTQTDVARLAGVSRAVVSHVVSNRPAGGITITEETRRRVLAAIEVTGYQPDASAQSLRLGKTRSVGVLIPDTQNPHYWQVVRGVEDAARPHGYDLFFSSTSLDPDRELAGVRALTRRRVDGLILMLTYYDKLESELLALRSSQSALVLFGLPPSSALEVDTAEPSHGEGAAEMMAHLLGLGHRRIALVLGVATPTLGVERLAAYEAALRAAGLPVDPELIVHTGPQIEDGYGAALHLLDLRPRPTAIVAVNDYLAIGVLRACVERGVRVPNDVSVAGFDDIDVAAYLTPGLTTVRVSAEEMGRRAFCLLLDRIEHPASPPQHVRVPAQLVLRASTGPACPDEGVNGVTDPRSRRPLPETPVLSAALGAGNAPNGA
jgi:DNA-binding LacI/PurR family transcriptional regulator